MPEWSFLPVPAVYSQRQAAQTAAKPNSSTSELLQFERMENFSRIRTIERVGKWSKAKSVVDVKNTAGLVQTPNVHYVPYVPNDQTDPVFQWFCNLPGEPIVDEETLYQLLTLDDDDNHEFSRSIVGCWQEDFMSGLDKMEKNWLVARKVLPIRTSIYLTCLKGAWRV